MPQMLFNVIVSKKSLYCIFCITFLHMNEAWTTVYFIHWCI